MDHFVPDGVEDFVRVFGRLLAQRLPIGGADESRCVWPAKQVGAVGTQLALDVVTQQGETEKRQIVKKYNIYLVYCIPYIVQLTWDMLLLLSFKAYIFRCFVVVIAAAVVVIANVLDSDFKCCVHVAADILYGVPTYECVCVAPNYDLVVVIMSCFSISTVLTCCTD